MVTVALPVPEVGVTVNQLGMLVMVQVQLEVIDIEALPDDELKLKLDGEAVSAADVPACETFIVCTRPQPLMNKVALCAWSDMFSK